MDVVMGRVVDILERPVVSYLVVLLASTIVALIMFLLGGSIAEVTNPKNAIYGVTFRAGGALAGFLIIFVFSMRAIRNFQTVVAEQAQALREYVLRTEGAILGPVARTLMCEYRLFDTDNGDWDDWKLIPSRQEAGGLKILVREMKPNHVIAVRLRNGSGVLWESQEDLAYGVSVIVLRRADSAPLPQAGG